MDGRLLAASEAGALDEVRQLLADGCAAHTQETEYGRSALMLAAAGGHEPVVRLLLEAGAPWNAIDRHGACAGNYALDAGHQGIVDLLVDAAVRAELVLGAAERHVRTAAASNAEYLSRGVRYDGDRLIDAEDDAVMMQWEAPLMEVHAERLCATGGDVMNVGFGMGIIDTAIAARKPRSHTIIEAHPAVYERMVRDGWTTRPGVHVYFGRWQDVLPTLVDKQFDGIFYDTFGEHDTDMADFHQQLPQILRPGGLYSFFNGMCPFNVFFQGVACAVVQLELQALGFSSSFESMPVRVPPEKDAEWADIKRKYFFSDTYYLPTCLMDGGQSGAAAPQPESTSTEMVLARSRPTTHAIGQILAALPAPACVEWTGLDPTEDDETVPARFERLNGSALRLLASTLRSPLSVSDTSGLRQLLAEQVLPHYEEAGWRLLEASTTLWAAVDAGQKVGAAAEDVAAPLDANSAEIVRAVGRLVAEGSSSQVDELQLAVLTNPLATMGSTDEGGGEAAGPAAIASEGSEVAAGRDSTSVPFQSTDEFWRAECGNGDAQWYGASKAFWDAAPVSVGGMLGGLEQLHAPDVKGSLQFIDTLRALSSEEELPTGVALDCGAGIGRVSGSVLLERFDAVELLEPVQGLLEGARDSLPPSRVNALHLQSLQDFVPPKGSEYALVWVQWVLNYLTDADLVAFLRRCSAALGTAGCVVVKESVARPTTGFFVDRTDSSITRMDSHFRRIFAEAGLRVVAFQVQPDFPREVFPVHMYALRPA